jgi:hypothetical protein
MADDLIATKGEEDHAPDRTSFDKERSKSNGSVADKGIAHGT